MNKIKYFSSLLYLTIIVYPYVSYACNTDLKDLVAKSEISEHFTSYKYLIKSGEKWFHLSQDDECWISIRQIKRKDNKNHFVVK